MISLKNIHFVYHAKTKSEFENSKEPSGKVFSSKQSSVVAEYVILHFSAVAIPQPLASWISNSKTPQVYSAVILLYSTRGTYLFIDYFR